ncbi:MAG: penicillin-binding protein [Candidatus Giovannonibacteria bacterium]|nr:MAG: penicillin-binding protein [Candidatus Giovannonibacteria bacterium]
MKRFLLRLAVSGVLLAGALLFFAASVNLPDLNGFEERRVAQSTKIYDRTGEVLLYDVHGEEKRTIVPFSEIPRHMKNATIAVEDDSFYQHFGFRPLAFLRAVFVNALRGSFEQGGSTITQQLAKTTLLTPQKTIFRKIKEIIISFKIEARYSKDEILNFYLNQIPYGNGAYGAEAAAETFFGKHAKDLNVKEAAYLASLPKAPSYYSPYGKHRDELDSRAAFVLERMRKLGFLSEKEYNNAKNEAVKFSPARAQGIIAPHFVIEVREELNKKFGEDAVEKSGFKVTTALDVDLQSKTEEVINKYAEENEKNFNAKNESVVAIDPKTGDVLAVVGSRNYFDIEREGNFNITTAHRQPGSALKPFIYATAFKKGFTPETVLFDLPTEFNPLCTPDGKPTAGVQEDKCYHPQNFDNKFRGPVPLREALAQSLNVPSVKTLYLAGLEESLSTARDFGITSLNEPERYGLTLVLGGGEVSLLELTSAYSVFANDGVRNPYRYILKIEDAEGKIIYEAASEPRNVIDNNIARAINDILSDNKARAPSFGEFSALYFPDKKVAAKTGTTNDYRDAWVIGYTPDVVVGAWAGNNDNSPMEKKVAGFIVAPWWHEIMEYAAGKLPPSEFVSPDPFLQNVSDQRPYARGEWRGGKEFTVDKISGGLATEYTPKELLEKKVVLEVRSILHWVDINSPQLKNWEDPVRKWAAASGLTDQNDNIIPKTYDSVHVPQNFPRISQIQLSPQKNAYDGDDLVVLRPTTEGKYHIEQADYFAGDEYLGSIKLPPFEFALNLSKTKSESNFIPVRVKIYDAVGNTAEQTINIVLKN